MNDTAKHFASMIPGHDEKVWTWGITYPFAPGCTELHAGYTNRTYEGAWNEAAAHAAAAEAKGITVAVRVFRG